VSELASELRSTALFPERQRRAVIGARVCGTVQDLSVHR